MLAAYLERNEKMKLKKLIIATSIAISPTIVFAGGPIEPIMATIKGGSFDMGSTTRESSQPVHKVNLKTFSMGKYEVTVREFRQFVKATNYQVPQECRHELDGWFKQSSKGNYETSNLVTSDFQPVVCITWEAANDYAKWLARETGKPYRLPTEAEWEYAARAGTTGRFYFGDDESLTKICEYENTSDLSGENILQRDANTSYHNWGAMANCQDHQGYASIVGMYKPNPNGLYDLISNVREFLADCYVADYKEANADGSPQKTEDCEMRSTRGSSWHWEPWKLTDRARIPVDFPGGVDGFRLAMDGKAPKQSKITLRFKKQLAFAQQQEKKRRDLAHKVPTPVQNARITHDNGNVILSWDEHSDAETYRIYRNNVPGQMFKLYATNLTGTKFVDGNAAGHKYEYAVVAVKNHLQSMYSESLATTPGWLPAPGKIEAEWATSHEGSSISFSSDKEDKRGGNTLTGREGISKDAVLKYQIEVPEAGTYQLTYRIASPEDRKGFEIFANEKKAGTSKVIKTGGYHDWETQQGVTVQLKKGKNTLTLKSLESFWKLNWISISKA